MRRDPVTGGKVRVAATWAQQRITGADVEHDPRVTGDMPGSCSVITGTSYQGPRTLHDWCDPAVGEAAERQLPRRPAAAAVTGDAPMRAEFVTGMARGAERTITGTPYYRDVGAAPIPKDAIAAVDAGFSVHSPQRTAQLRANSAAVDEPGEASRITGSFAVSNSKLTGNLEFTFRPRAASDREAKPGRSRVSGEGRNGGRVSGDAWVEQQNVTGTEGFTAVDRNPSQRGGKPKAFAGSRLFKAQAINEEPKQLVTGLLGWSSNSAAKVTLSGGAHG
jgi:hypothetical protein